MAKIFVVDHGYQATVLACKVQNEYEADLCVYVVGNEYQATKDAHWFYVDHDYQASTKLFWTDEYSADLKVFFVENEYQAKWNKGHSLQERL